jgi:hypothetical protein
MRLNTLRRLSARLRNRENGGRSEQSADRPARDSPGRAAGQIGQRTRNFLTTVDPST